MNSTIVLITGANSGIGYAATEVFVHASDAFHVIMACRSAEKAQAAKSEIEASNPKGKVSTIQLDITDEKSIQDAAAHVQQKFGRLDVLVNNAGTGSLTAPDLSAKYKLCLNTNVIGSAMVAEIFRPLLLKCANPYSIYIGTGQRSIVRNATQKPSGHANLGDVRPYQVSKAALNMLAVLEWRDFGPELKVFVVSPGFVVSNARGTDEASRSGWGMAGDPKEAGQLLLSIVKGKRDTDVGRIVHKDGVYDW